MGIILDRKEAELAISKLKSEGKKVVFTNGCFDLLHVGHLRYIQKAKSFGDILVIGVNSDRSINRLKGENRPILPEDERAELIGGIGAVDYVVIFDEDTPVETILHLKPDVHVKGGDYEIKDLPEAKTVFEYGGEVKIVKFIEGKSTTSIIERIKESLNV